MKCDSDSVGGAVFCNARDFVDAGMENEKFVSWGCEDFERYERISKLGYSIRRVDGILYHLSHKRNLNNGPKNPYFKKNEAEYLKVKNMNRSQLIEYISTWEWTKHK